MNNMGGGDDISKLPINKDRSAKPGDLELVYNLFQPKNIGQIKQAINPFKTSALGAIIFGILSLPIILKLVEAFVKNPVYSRIMLIAAFLVIFFIAQKMLKM